MSKQAETVKGEGALAAISPSGGGGRMPGEERRLQIVGVAMRLFSERGFRGTTTKEIAQAAGVSEAIIFRHFATKDDLYTAILDYKACAGGGGGPEKSVVEEFRCGVADAMQRKDDRAVFAGLAEHMMRHHEQDAEFLRLLFYSALEGHQLSQMFWDRNVSTLYEFLGAYIRERQRDGVFRALDPFVAVRAFSGMIIHHSVTSLLWDTSRRLLDISNEEAAREFTEIFLRGIAAYPTSAKTTRNGSGRSETVKRATAQTARPRKRK